MAIPYSPDTTVVRAFSLLLPLVLCLALWGLRQANKSQLTGALLAFLWNLASLVALQTAVNYFGWWRFEAKGGVLFSIPVDLLIGWSLLWGAIPLLTSMYLRLPIWFLIMLIFDLFFMPLCAPVLQLNQNWILGEFLLLLVCFIPAQLLGRWTIENRHLFARAFLQMICFSILFLIS